jgi:hypothetical protein
MQIAHFDRKNLKLVVSDFQKEIAEVAKKYGISASIGPARFTANNFTCKIDVSTVKNIADIGMSKFELDFKNMARAYGLDPVWLGSTIELNGTQYRITGLNTRRRKKPVIIQRVRDNKEFICTITMVQMAKARSWPATAKDKR